MTKRVKSRKSPFLFFFFFFLVARSPSEAGLNWERKEKANYAD